MKRMTTVLMVVISVLFSAGNVLAGDASGDGGGNVGFDGTVNGTNTNTNTLTGTAIAGSASDSDAAASVVLTNEDKREHITALPGMVGTFVNAPAIIDDGKWHPLPAEVFTVGELKNMIDSSGYWDRQGTWLDKMTNGPIKTTFRVKKAEGTLADDTQIRVINLEGTTCRIRRTLAESFGVGPYSAPFGAIESRTILEPVLGTHARFITGSYRSRKDGKSSGLGFGSGAAGSVVGNGDRGAGSLAVGAIAGSSMSYGRTAYDLELKAVEIVCQSPPPPVPPVKVESPPPQVEPKGLVCNPDEIRKEIKKVEKAIEDCKFWCLDNLKNRAKAAYLYGRLYICTGKRDKQLLKKMIEHSNFAQQNYDEVHNPTNPRIVSKANWDEQYAVSVLASVYWNQAAAIRELDGHAITIRGLEQGKKETATVGGRETEIRFARVKGMERMPDKMEEIKEIIILEGKGVR